jgi:peptide/nickel transport system permease protein
MRRLGPGALVALAIIAAWLVVAVLGSWLAPHGSGEVVDLDAFNPSSRAFPLGTDYLGRDVLSRVLNAARYTVGIAFVAASIAMVTGTLFGLAAATGNWIDIILSRIFDTILAIPTLMFGLVVVASLGPSIPVLIGTLAVVYTPGAFRTARALAMNVAALDFVTVARARGERLPHIVVREILPNVVVPLAADFGVRFVLVVLLLSGLSVLGVGVQPPEADLGSLVRENVAGLGFGSLAVLFPALAIASLTVSVNLLIDSVSGRRR